MMGRQGTARRKLPAALLLLSACTGASAGPPPEPAAAVTPSVPEAPPRPPAALPPPIVPGGYYISRYGVSAEEAARRAALEPLVSALSQDLHEHPAQGFSAIWIEHEPGYAVVIALKPPSDRAAVLARADRSLRPYIQFRTATRTAAEIARDGDRIALALRPIRAAWSGGYDVRRGQFVFTFGSPERVAEARRLLPADLAGQVALEVGPVPVAL